MYPKSRIDALTDGLFGVAMTILVLDLRLPDSFRGDGAGLVGALRTLWPRFLPYLLSFYVL
ncbi:MAG TPA: TMEM175 family protein, partial [Candidatus Bathyarchaeia archaeon]|nr:TMEM175 family protein [Candidatus Bathyarchaeia archaeon]